MARVGVSRTGAGGARSTRPRSSWGRGPHRLPAGLEGQGPARHARAQRVRDGAAQPLRAAALHRPGDDGRVAAHRVRAIDAGAFGDGRDGDRARREARASRPGGRDGLRYGAAILGRLAGEVVSVERYRSLAIEAQARLDALGVSNVVVRHATAARAGTQALPMTGSSSMPPWLKSRRRFDRPAGAPTGRIVAVERSVSRSSSCAMRTGRPWTNSPGWCWVSWRCRS